MAKAASPDRLQSELMKAASFTGLRYRRSAAEQFEYWADIGRKVADIIAPDSLLAVTSGLAKISIDPVVSRSLDPD